MSIKELGGKCRVKNCRICTESRFLSKMKKQLTKNDFKFLSAMHERLMICEDDALYWKLKFKGEWPS